MSQVDSFGARGLSRRNMLRGAATVATLLPPTMVLTASDVSLLQLEKLITDALSRRDVVLTSVERTELLYLDWVRKNPRATSEQKTAAAASIGHTDAEALDDLVQKEIVGLADKVANTRSTTVAGQQCKARLAERLEDSDIAWSVVADIAAVGAQ